MEYCCWCCTVYLFTCCIRPVRHIVRLIALLLQYEYYFVVDIFVHQTTITTMPVVRNKYSTASNTNTSSTCVFKKTNGSFDCYIMELYALNNKKYEWKFRLYIVELYALNITFPPRSFDYDIVEFWLLHRWTTGWPFTILLHFTPLFLC